MSLPRWSVLTCSMALAVGVLGDRVVLAASEQAPSVAPQPAPAQAAASLRQRLDKLTAEHRPKVAGAELASVAVLDAFYRQRDDRRAWQRQAQVQALQRAIADSPAEGLSPADFHDQALAAVIGYGGLSSLSGQARDDADLLLTDSLLRYLHHRLFGKVDPVAIDRKLNGAEAATLEGLVTQLDTALAAPDLGKHLAHLVREPAFYTRLKETLSHYRGLAANGGWETVPAGGKLALGSRDQRVVALRERLRASGEYRLAGSADPKVFDRGLQAAVKVFQQSRGLAVDGVVGPSTLAELNVSASQRVDQIRVNLERMRWVYRDLPKNYLLVDVAAFRVNLMEDDAVAWSTRVQVGREDRQTPTFRDRLEYLELNPTWTVPPTILRQDILPKARVNPAYVAKKGLKAFDRNGRTVPLSAVNWNLPARAFPYTLRQDGGGEKAALGRIKFMFPNRFSVYLHDTPSRSLFNRPVRMTSSGCVRVDKPFELAELVLRQPDRWNQDKLKGLVDTGKTRTVRLKEPLEVILAYWTVDVLGDGPVRFRSDIYGRDPTVLTALDGDVRMTVKLPPDPEPEPVAEPSPEDPPAPARPIKAEVRPVGQSDEPKIAVETSIRGLLPASGL